ncbi:MAG: SAM-dependent methyltransferase [Enterobacterales bacterium]|jgi:SAM-dependent methyltransferase
MNPVSNSCQICGECFGEHIPYPSLNNNSLQFSVISICSGCGLGAATPTKTQATLDQYYNSGEYWSDTVEPSPALSQHYSSQAKERIRKSVKYITAQNIDILDIGAGQGWIGHWASVFLGGSLKSVDLIEPDEDLNNTFGENTTRYSSLEECNKKYDLIFMNHVFEHVAEPVEFMKKVISYLKPGGIVYVEVPNEDWKYKEDVLPHTFFFTELALTSLGKRLGVNTMGCHAFGVGRSKLLQNITLRDRVLNKLYSFAVKFKFEKISNRLDRYIWRYDKVHTDGIWLQWLFVK